MEIVSVNGRNFRIFITPEQIASRVEELAAEINREYRDKDLLIVAVLNGAFLFVADLIRHLEMQPELQFIRVSSYGDEMGSSGNAKVMLGLKEEANGRHVLILEDIVDSGHTSDFLLRHIQQQNPASLRMGTLLFKPESFGGETPPHYVGFEIPPAFVVGYGLDYAQRGRELPGIYQLDEGEG